MLSSVVVLQTINYDMHVVIERALNVVREELNK